jgi:hypothetical protein
MPAPGPGAPRVHSFQRPELQGSPPARQAQGGAVLSCPGCRDPGMRDRRRGAPVPLPLPKPLPRGPPSCGRMRGGGGGAASAIRALPHVLQNRKRFKRPTVPRIWQAQVRNGLGPGQTQTQTKTQAQTQTQTRTQMHRQTDRQTDRQTGRQTSRQTNRQTCRQASWYVS